MFKKIPVNASGSGDHRRKESLAHIQCRVAGPILVNLLLCPVSEHMIDVRMTQCPIQRRVGSVAMKVVNPGNINAQPTADAADHQVGEVYVRAKLPIVHLDGGDAVFLCGLQLFFSSRAVTLVSILRLPLVLPEQPSAPALTDKGRRPVSTQAKGTQSDPRGLQRR